MLCVTAFDNIASVGRGVPLFSIGQFSKITGLTVKTLRFYHEQGLLKPSCVDDQTGYRYYSERKVETVRVIMRLRTLEFSLVEISEILNRFDDEADILDHLQRKKDEIDSKLQHFRGVRRSLDAIILTEKEARTAMRKSEYQVEEKQVGPILIAAVRIQGKYCDCGQGFSKIGRSLGRFINGKPFLLHYDREYRENDANFEACMPIKKLVEKEGISTRELPGGRCVSLLHKGPWEELGRSYEKITAYVNEHGYEVEIPTREIYLKGPGMIFRGNPKNYLTEIQMMITG